MIPVLGDEPVRQALDIAGHLNRAGKWSLKGGYVAAGTGMRNMGAGSITIKGIPKASTVERAYLYWNILSSTQASSHALGYINGHAVTGTLVGTTMDPCWGMGSSRSYRANVTNFVSATDGTYDLSGFASGSTAGEDPWTSVDVSPLLEGASLVIIYRQSRYPTTSIFLYDGAVESRYSTGYAETTITGIPLYLSYLAYTTAIVADGQSNAVDRGVRFNGTKLPTGQVSLNGSDPRSIPGSYLYGNLSDTDLASRPNTAQRGAPVGDYMGPLSLSAKVAWRGTRIASSTWPRCCRSAMACRTRMVTACWTAGRGMGMATSICQHWATIPSTRTSTWKLTG